MTREQKIALAVATGTSFATAFSGSATNLAIPAMGTYFHMGAASVGWITTAYVIVIAAMAVPFGKIADSTSRRNMLAAGVAVFGVASVAAIFMHAAAGILIVRAVMGVGAAMIFASNMPIAINAFPGNQRGKAIGIVTSGIYTGLAIGPALGGFLNNLFGWQAIFLFGAAVAFASMILTLAGVPADRQEKSGAGFDLVFVKIELGSDNPVIDVRIFAEDRVFTLSNLTALFNYSATFALGYFASIYLQVAQGLNSQAAGLIMMTQPVFMAIFSPWMGRMSDRVPAYKLVSGGMAVCALTLLFFGFAQAHTPIWAIVIALAAAGFGIALFSSPNTNVIMSCVPPQKFAVANSIVSTMRTSGQTIGMAIITLVVSGTIGNVSLYEVPAENLIHTMHICFFIFTGLCILGIFMSLQRRKS